MLTGGLLVDKPQGLTSHDVVARVRRIAGERRCGHTGTLDPIATGLLVLCLGRATRLARFLSGGRKSYLATVRFGFSTDTYDRTGDPTSEATDRCPPAGEIETVLDGLRGQHQQEPPPFSAKRVKGKRAHRLARAGVPVHPDPVPVDILELELLEVRPPRARLRATVSAGTYIRSLAHELGRRLSCGAHLEELRRTGSGPFRVEEAAGLEELSELAARGGLGQRLLSASDLLRDLPAVSLDLEEAARLAHGRSVSREPATPAPGELPDRLRACDARGNLVAVVELDRETSVLRPLVVLSARAGGGDEEA